MLKQLSNPHFNFEPLNKNLNSNYQLSSNFVKNIVSIENFDEVKGKLKNLSKNKGKIRRGPFWNAFNRENLGSIPGKIENILINERSDPTKKGFLSNTGRFSNRTDNIKNNFPGPGAYSSSSTMNNSNISIYSSKGYCNGFVSTTVRFDDKEEYTNKYLPGPSDYKPRTTIEKKVENANNYKYNFLYRERRMICLKQNFDNPGPGHYEPIVLKTEISAAPTSSKCDEDFFFKSTTKRFDYDKPLGSNPNKTAGSFINGSQNETNYTSEHMKDTQSGFPDLYHPLQTITNFNRTSNQLSPIKGEVEDSLNNLKEASEIKPPIVYPASKISRFFKSEQKKDEDPLIKLGIKKEEKTNEQPGPGTYKTEQNFGPKSKNDLAMHERFLVSQRTFYRERFHPSQKKKKHVRKNDFYSTQSCFNTDKKQNQLSIFASKSPKGLKVNSMNPGPCYYSPKVSPAKTSFNLNKDSRWLNY